MMKNLSIVIACGLVSFSTSAFAAITDSTPNTTLVKSGYFIGVGGGYNSTNLNQNLSGTGVSNVYSNNILVAYGSAGGPADTFNNYQSNFAPMIQAGYFKRMTNSSFLWGAKVFYKYLNTSFTNNNVNIPQYGAFTNTESAPANTSFTGHVLIASTQTTLSHQFALMPFVGNAFTNSYVYFGAGPALFKTESKINNGTGYADINGVHTNITGTAVSFSNTKWVWGAAAQIGMAYYLDPTWFIDANYSYAITQHFRSENTGPFSNTPSAGYTTSGTFYVSNSQQLKTQAITLSINKTFSM